MRKSSNLEYEDQNPKAKMLSDGQDDKSKDLFRSHDKSDFGTLARLSNSSLLNDVA